MIKDGEHTGSLPGPSADATVTAGMKIGATSSPICSRRWARRPRSRRASTARCVACVRLDRRRRRRARRSGRRAASRSWSRGRRARAAGLRDWLTRSPTRRWPRTARADRAARRAADAARRRSCAHAARGARAARCGELVLLGRVGERPAGPLPAGFRARARAPPSSRCGGCSSARCASPCSNEITRLLVSGDSLDDVLRAFADGAGAGWCSFDALAVALARSASAASSRWSTCSARGCRAWRRATCACRSTGTLLAQRRGERRAGPGGRRRAPPRCRR